MQRSLFHHKEIAGAVMSVLDEHLPDFHEVEIGFAMRKVDNEQRLLVRPTYMEQPDNGATNRTFQQTYAFQVQLSLPGHADDAQYVMRQCGRVVDALSADPYVRETGWASQVVNVRYEPVPTVWFIVKRAEVWMP